MLVQILAARKIMYYIRTNYEEWNDIEKKQRILWLYEERSY